MNVNEKRRKALAWSNEMGEYTQPSVLVEKIKNFLCESRPSGASHPMNVDIAVFKQFTSGDSFKTPNKNQDVRGRADVHHGGVKDTAVNAAPDYKSYRKTHFTKMKCPPDCPYCKCRRGSV